MSDVLLSYFPDRAEFDVAINAVKTDFILDDGFETAVNISLFSDARDENDGGCWIDALIAPASIPASLLWKLQRAKIIDPETLRLAEDWARQALQWMFDDKVAKSITVVVERIVVNGLAWNIEIEKPDNVIYKYRPLWQNIQSQAA